MMKLKNNVIIKSKNFKRAEKIIIFLHGYGSDGGDFESGIKHIASEFEDTVFLSPDGPFECKEYSGRKWFHLSEEISNEEISSGLTMAAPILQEYIEDAKKGCNCEDVSLVGFSQGAMLSFEMLYYSKISRIVACAGVFAAPKNKMPISMETKVLIAHSEDDNVVPYKNAILSKAILDKLGIEASIKTCHGIGHSISMDVWNACAEFLKG